MSRALEAIVGDLLEPLRSARPSPSQWRLLSWDADAGITLVLEKGPRRVRVELTAREDARPCFAQTKHFNLAVCGEGEAPTPLDDDMRRAVEQLVRMLRVRERRLPTIAPSSIVQRGMVREVEVDRVLVVEGPRRYYVNPYVGCMVGCTFCWAAEGAALSRSLEGVPAVPWGRWVDVKVNAPTVLRQELALHSPGTVRLSPVVTDPYQPLERKYRVTRGCLEAMAGYGFVPVVLTREPRVLDDVEILLRCPRAAVGLSIPTDDDCLRRAFEPGASPIGDRFEALRRLHAAGVRTFAVLQPVLPMNVSRMVTELAPYVRTVRIDRMHGGGRSRELYAQAGCLHAMDDGFVVALVHELTEGFRARGVRIDSLDDPAVLFEESDGNGV